MAAVNDAELARRAGVPVAIVAPIRAIESGGNALAMRFETRLFLERTGTTIEGHDRAAFNRAYAMDPQAAVESSSWGLYQILGRAGIAIYGSPQAFVRAFNDNPIEVSQRLFVKYFEGRPALRDAANRGDWRALAEGYNGSDRWYRRFMELLDAGAPAVGGGLVVLGLLGLGFWWWRSR